jgi:hypothetical protein
MRKVKAMPKEPMKVVPDDLFPAEVQTPEERFNFLGRRLFTGEGTGPERAQDSEPPPREERLNERNAFGSP